jgi:hexosaminidase
MLQLFTSLMVIFMSLLNTGYGLSIIPNPKKIISLEGHFIVRDDLKIWLMSSDADSYKIASYLKDELLQSESIQIQDGTGAFCNSPGDIVIDISELYDIGEEGYELLIKNDCLHLKASTYKGAFWALQTLRQLKSEENSQTIFPCASIIDEPFLSYRGLHLDVSRHMFSVDFIMKYIDLMALHKLNYFHWHLTDDQGWRLEIKKRPHLQTIGAFRDKTAKYTKVFDEFTYDNTPYGGFYTHEEIKQIVKYAADRSITIIPEIDIPGHCLSALASYPELGCTSGPYQVGTHWMISDDILCAGNEHTFEFLKDVFDEVCELFPGPYIHIGGDEVPKEAWQKCKKCQNQIAKHDLKDELGLQRFLIHKIKDYLKTKNKSVICWEEILESSVDKDVLIMCWMKKGEGLKNSLESHHKSILCPQKPFYFDHYQDQKENEPQAIGGLNTIESVYTYNPLSFVSTESHTPLFWGIQANVWTEFMPTSAHVEYMCFPRVSAIAEVAWSQPECKDFTSFKQRFKQVSNLLDHMKVNYKP